MLEELYNYAKGDEELKRKVKEESTISEVTEDAVIFQLKDVSVLAPFRKKLNLIISVSPISGKPALSLSKDMIPQLTVTQLNNSVKFATFLPFPEKKNMIYLFICYGQEPDRSVNEFLLVAMNKEATLKQFKTTNILTNEAADFSACVDYIRKQAILVGFRISDPFTASSSNSSFHVEAHRGTKEGTLYFLPDHVLFGFKKPILLFSSQEIESITYSSITRLTFNVTLITKTGEKFEFSMIDQNEYTLIDDYVKRKQVIDNSMSEENKAKTAHKDQNATESSSLLEEAAQQLKGEGGMGIGSDDEEADVDFEIESNLSDGSESGSESSDEDDSESEDQDTQKSSSNASASQKDNEILDTEDTDMKGADDDNVSITMEEEEIANGEEGEEEEEVEEQEADEDETGDEEEDSGVEYD